MAGPTPSPPLREILFAVLDTETTGWSPAGGGLTEIAAARFQGGDCLGTYQTLVDPGTAIPPFITDLTGITGEALRGAPPVSAVLPSLLEFLGPAVLVGHNLPFDLSFLDAALVGSDRPPLAPSTVDTLTLARRLLAGEVPDCRLGTLAAVLRLDHRPSHRALDDVLATADLLHLLIERASAYGVEDLADLQDLPRLLGHRQSAKLELTAGLPREPGIYWFEGRGGEVLLVGRAGDIRARTRSWFVRRPGVRLGGLLDETTAVGHLRCAGPLEAAVAEIRLVDRLRPRYNRRLRAWDRWAYLVPSSGTRPGMVATRRPPSGAGPVLGPFGSLGEARGSARALEGLLPDPRERLAALAGARSGLEEERLRDLLGEGGSATVPLARVVDRHRREEALREGGRLVLEARSGERLVFEGGRLVIGGLGEAPGGPARARIDPGAGPVGPLTAGEASELDLLATWLDGEERGGAIRVVEGELDWPCGERRPAARAET